jgi:glycosyltransferase involved in cell wall biosynthesis
MPVSTEAIVAGNNFKISSESTKRYSGIYIISESGALYPSTGASQHIRAGFEQLSEYFEMQRVLFCKPPEAINTGSSIPVRNKTPRPSALRKFAKWFFLLFSNHFNFFHYYGVVRKIKPSFIYERAGYLNFNGLVISRILGIPHFYEVNGIAANDHQKYFPVFCNRLAFRLEKLAYNKTTIGFFVGGLNRYFNIPAEKYIIIQNGIDQDFAEKFRNKKNVTGNKINITFIGQPMDHHRLDILVGAFRLLKHTSSFRLHFIGPGLESLKDQIPSLMEVKFYGKLTHEEIADVVGDFNVGVVPFALDYFSHVKVFMYGASKLLLVLPDALNFKSIFTDEEVLFFKNGDSADLARKLDSLIGDSSIVTSLSENIYSKTTNQFTWEKIYKKVAGEIAERIMHKPISLI